MTNKNAPILKMFLAVIKICTANATAFGTLPAFGKAYTKFTALVEAINADNKNLQGDRTGITEDKYAQRQAMATATLVVSGALQAYANEVNNHTLAADANVVETDILQSKETDSDDICLHIHDLGMANLAQLADYGITQATLTALETTITNFTTKIGTPRQHVINTKTTRGNLETHFKEAETLLDKQLDKLMLVLKPTNADFYSQYIDARNIIPQGGGGAKDEVAVAPVI